MMELIQINQKSLNSKERVTIELIRDGKEFLEKFNLNKPMVMEAVGIIYRYLNKIRKIPHNLYNFFIAAYYIIERHPRAFPMHTSKQTFLRSFGIEVSTLEYCVSQIVGVLDYVKILDGKHYPYFLDSEKDIALNLTKKVISDKTEKVAMDFLVFNQPFNTNILCEEITNKLIFEMRLFPEELFEQFYLIFHELIVENLKPHIDYIDLQLKTFI